MKKMTRKEIERKRFWFRVRVITVFGLMVFGSVKGFQWIKGYINQPQVIYMDGQVTQPEVAENETQVVKTPSVEPNTDEKTSEFKNSENYVEANESRYQTYFEKQSQLDPNDVVTLVNMNHDYAFYDESIVKEAPYQGSLLVLCNKYFKIPENYTIDQLVKVPEELHASDGKSYMLDKRALEAYEVLEADAKNAGIDLTIVSAYRTYEFQNNLYNKYVNRSGKAEADTYSARPGHSEHESGLAVDLNQVETAFENTKAFNWLNENAHVYGFILRYPKGKESLTGYMYEPWHYRYVGKEVAAIIKSENITFDEYHALYLMP